jgi:hypothetical protein
MGVIKQGILGGFSGSVANVVGSSWKGIAVIKSKPLSVANPRTAAQQAQRGKFGQTVAFASAILAAIVKPLWDRFAQGESGYNAFIKANIDAFNSDGLATPADLVISSGKMAATAIELPSASSAFPQVTISYTDDSGEGLKLTSDEAFVVVADSDGNVLGTSSGASTRGDGQDNIDCNRDLVQGETLSLYLAFRRADGTVVSNTAYNTVTVS